MPTIRRVLADESGATAIEYGHHRRGQQPRLIILDAIEAQLKTGARRPLMLANSAIDTHRNHLALNRLSAGRAPYVHS